MEPQNLPVPSCATVVADGFSFGPFAGGDALAEYVSRYRRTDVPALEIGGALDLYPDRVPPATFAPQLTWEHPWPFNNRAGVYMIYDEALQLMYVGKVSMSRFFGHRLYEYFGNGDACVPKAEWLHPARFVINIAVPEEMPFEAPALEEFLIRKLQPPCNGTGK